MAKIKLALLTGGKSTEHEVSLRSGKSILDAIDKSKYEIFLIGIDKEGKWFLNDPEQYLIKKEGSAFFELVNSDREVFLWTENQLCYLKDVKSSELIVQLDVVFPVLHGTYGEDGTLQGVLKANNAAFVGTDLMASAIGMDKDIAKRLWRDAGIPIADFVCLTSKNRDQYNYNSLSASLGSPLFIKPANAGSSVGVHKVTSEKEYQEALADAFLYDRKLLVEEAISGIEVECAILGNENPMSSVIGAIKPTHQFYSYEAKYVDDDGAKTQIPANIPEEVSELIRETAVKAYETIGCEGLSRVDFFLRPDHSIILNEINTLPGFTSISMYPKLWEATGIPFTELINRLIGLGIDRHQKTKQLKVVQ
ncbi:MAG: D-alanine--D-alanine ligase [Saprospiraceae bacterium]|nr:D-alanine--D-alanine ligase [Saprospiraceae bacterium]